MTTKIEIKSIFGEVLFEYKKNDNTIRDTIAEAIKQYADLQNANLRNANLQDANLQNAKNVPYIPLNCPSDGAFVGWKKVNNKLVKLLIPDDAKRSSATSYKCRCDKAKVLSITSIDEKTSFDSVVNLNYTPNIKYCVGEMVIPDSFDNDRWNECSNGIHFFINKQDAINY